MSTSSNSGISNLDIDMISYLFDSKCRILEELEEYRESGMFSTQLKLQELKQTLIDFLKKYQNSNSMFYVFLGEAKEECLKIVMSTVKGEINHLTKRFIIVIDNNLTDLHVEQQSISNTVITFNVQ